MRANGYAAHWSLLKWSQGVVSAERVLCATPYSFSAWALEAFGVHSFRCNVTVSKQRSCVVELPSSPWSSRLEVSAGSLPPRLHLGQEFSPLGKDPGVPEGGTRRRRKAREQGARSDVASVALLFFRPDVLGMNNGGFASTSTSANLRKGGFLWRRARLSARKQNR